MWREHRDIYRSMTMEKRYKFAIVGAGNGGKALAGHIATKGHHVSLFEGLEPSEAFLQLSKEKEIFLEGDIKSRGNLNRVTTSMEEAVVDADVILVVVPAFAHGPIFSKLIPLLKDVHRIVLIPGNFGSLLLRKMMHEMGINRKVSISETASLPYACRATSYNTVMIHKAKKALKIATYPVKANREIKDIMNTIAKIFIPGKNALEVSLDNINCVLHPLPVLLNIGAIEKNPETFSHYLDGITPLISEKITRMDEERIAIGTAYSLNLVSTLNQLKIYYGKNDSKDIYGYVNSNQSPYKDMIGDSLYSRYITEDVPYVVVPTMLLGEKVGIKAPLFKLCVDLASELHSKDYVESGHNLTNLGIADMGRNQLLAYIS